MEKLWKKLMYRMLKMTTSTMVTELPLGEWRIICGCQEQVSTLRWV